MGALNLATIAIEAARVLIGLILVAVQAPPAEALHPFPWSAADIAEPDPPAVALQHNEAGC